MNFGICSKHKEFKIENKKDPSSKMGSFEGFGNE